MVVCAGKGSCCAVGHMLWMLHRPSLSASLGVAGLRSYLVASNSSSLAMTTACTECDVWVACLRGGVNRGCRHAASCLVNDPVACAAPGVSYSLMVAFWQHLTHPMEVCSTYNTRCTMVCMAGGCTRGWLGWGSCRQARPSWSDHSWMLGGGSQLGHRRHMARVLSLVLQPVVCSGVLHCMHACLQPPAALGGRNSWLQVLCWSYRGTPLDRTERHADHHGSSAGCRQHVAVHCGRRHAAQLWDMAPWRMETVPSWLVTLHAAADARHGPGPFLLACFILSTWQHLPCLCSDGAPC
jgi:hypothetical protein